jgi:hypothetical protein
MSVSGWGVWSEQECRPPRRATIFGHGREWIWVGHARSSQRPVALIGRDASGAVVTRRTLHGRAGFGR